MMIWKIAAMAALLVANLLAEASPAPGGQGDAVLEAAAATLRDAAGDRRIVVVGEFHGTREIPLLASHMVEGWAHEGPVRVGLELPSSLQPVMEAWINGGDRAAARAQMRIIDPAWTRAPDQQDGRRNLDVLDLLDRLRTMRAAGRDVGVFAFDIVDASGGAAARDLAMAHRFRAAHAALPDARWIIVTGNVHAMKFVPDYCPQCQESMTKHLADLRPFSVEVSAAAGAFHACMSNDPCGPVPSRDRPARAGPFSDEDTPFDYRVVLPRFTPARMP